MAAPLETISIVAPGFSGLNLQESPALLDRSYALVAKNAIIDSNGRIAARKGWIRQHGALDKLDSNAKVEAITEWVNNVGKKEIIFCADRGIFSFLGNDIEPTRIWFDVNTTSNRWQCANLNSKTYFFQIDHAPLAYDGTSMGYVSDESGYSGTVPEANCVLSAFGRLWVANTSSDKTTVSWTDSLQGEDWGSGTAGSLNLQTVMSSGISPIVALAEFNGFLTIFCRNQIITYSGADVPANMTVQDIISGVGCVSRDSVIKTGNDILFMSDTGVRSLGRIIQEKSAPLYDISYNVRNDIIESLSKQTESDIKAVYHDRDGYALYSFPDVDKTYCFDMRLRQEDGRARAMIWTLTPYSLYMGDKDLYMGFKGFLGKQQGYSDDGLMFTFTFCSPYLNKPDDEQSTSQLKIPKAMRVSAYGGYGYALKASWGFDYSRSQYQQSRTLPAKATVDEYNNNAEYFYGAEYGGNPEYPVHTTDYELRGDGRNMLIQITADILRQPLAIQQIDIFYKRGKIDHV